MYGYQGEEEGVGWIGRLGLTYHIIDTTYKTDN